MTNDNALIQEYKKKLEDELELQIDYISASVADDYAERVGLIRGLRSALNDFERIVKQYYPY